MNCLRRNKKTGVLLRLRDPPVSLMSESYWVSVCFSENTRMQKSPFWCGSKVEGTIRYSPGGSLKREHTSRRLMKVSDLAVWAWLRKKFLSRCTSRWPLNWRKVTIQIPGLWLYVTHSINNPHLVCSQIKDPGHQQRQWKFNWSHFVYISKQKEMIRICLLLL